MRSSRMSVFLLMGRGAPAGDRPRMNCAPDRAEPAWAKIRLPAGLEPMFPNHRRMQSSSLVAAAPSLPSGWRKALADRVDSNENVLATLEVDLDPALHFKPGALALTDRRLLAWEDGRWTEWQLAEDLALHHGDHSGVGTLELQDGEGRLAL